MPSSPWVRSKTTSGASVTRFSPASGKRLVTVWSGLSHIGAFPIGASFLIVVGTTKRLVLIGSKTLSVFRGAFFKEELFSILDQLRPEQGSGPKVRAPKFLTSRIPQMRLKMFHFSLTPDKD